ncbi:winged helix-turn-helix domain-containing protein [Luedemannella flava]|uniref:Winged helix-turn-helix domain-containing protein n=1 Tax=Luedemannella flava TaxID=349316 RepID=A0ABP4XXE3_9ACTN
MLKIFFAAEDIARIKVLPEPDPIWELVLSMFRLRGRNLDPALSTWRAAALAELRRPYLSRVDPTRPRGARSDAPRPDPSRDLPRELSLVFSLLPVQGYFADFLTPSDAVGADLDAGLEAIRGTPTRLLRADLDLIAAGNVLPTAAGGVARGDAATMTALTDVMRSYYDAVLAPVWSRVAGAFDAERTRLGQVALDGGVVGLLSALSPLMRWDDGVLHVNYPVEQELRLDGRGLVLVPSYFCWRYPVTLRDPDRAPVLVYPLTRPQVWVDPEGIEADPRAQLGALLGRNRAAVLAAVNGGCSTSELARRVGVSLAAASQHATVLRNAGLVNSRRHRHTMVHTLTSLGLAMLHGG